MENALFQTFPRVNLWKMIKIRTWFFFFFFFFLIMGQIHKCWWFFVLLGPTGRSKQFQTPCTRGLSWINLNCFVFSDIVLIHSIFHDPKKVTSKNFQFITPPYYVAAAKPVQVWTFKQRRHGNYATTTNVGPTNTSNTHKSNTPHSGYDSMTGENWEITPEITWLSSLWYMVRYAEKVTE